MAATMTYKAQPTQTLYDICLMTYGTLDMMVKLMLDNNINGLGDTNYAGKTFVYTVANSTTTALTSSNIALNIVYATGVYIPPGNGAPLSFLLQEDGSYLLQENGGGILL